MPDFSADIGQPSKAFTECDTKEFAFHSLGVDYYKHTHRGFNMTYSKWFELSTMSEFHDKWKLTAIDVDEFFRVERDSWATIRAMVAGGQQEEALEFIDEAMTYNSLVSIRRLAKHPEALYREASVFFFDQTEDPARYDELYAEEKIKRWIQDPELINNKELFFSPISALLPSDALSMPTEELEQTILQLRDLVQTGATASVLASEKASMLGGLSGTASSTLKNMLLRTEMLREYASLTDLLSKRI